MKAVQDISEEIGDHLSVICCSEVPITDQMDLVAAGLVDSLMMTELIYFIESRYGVRFVPEDLNPRTFRSARALAEFVVRKQAGHPVSAHS